MKKRFLVLSVILIFFSAVVYADEIYLNDGSVLKGAIIQITEREIEFDPDGERAFDVVDRREVTRIVYGDGRVVSYRLDTLIRNNGTAIRGAVIRVTDKELIYEPEGSEERTSVPRDEIDRIEYSDGKVVYLSKKDTNVEDAVIEARKQTGGFHDSWVRIAGFFGFGAVSNGIFDKEERVLRAYRADLIRAYILPRDYRMYNIFGSGGGEIDIMPPAIKFSQKRGFDFTGIKFGIRGRYGFQFVDSMIVDEGSYFTRVEGFELFRGRLMNYHYWSVGPVMNLIFSPRSNMFNFLINFYATAGQVFNGTLRAAAALRNAQFLTYRMLGASGPYGVAAFLPPEIANVTNTRQFNTTRFNGYTIRGGIGPHFSLNRYFPITFGMNVTYAYTNLKLGRALPIYYVLPVFYDGKKRAAHHEVGGEISAGVHF